MNKAFKLMACSILYLLFPLFQLHAQTKPSVPFSETELSEPVALVMLTIIILLLILIAVLGSAVKILPVSKRKMNASGKTLLFLLTGATALFASFGAAAQEATEEVVAATGSGLIGGLSQTSFYLLFGIIILELMIIFILILSMKAIIRPLSEMEVKEPKIARKRYAWFEKLNNTKSLDAQSEAEINLGHDYDGIGELDNPTPPWWQWGFRLSIVFAVIYMYVYHVSKSAPLQIEELAIANEKAERAKEAYLANSANRIDENNVTFLTDGGEIEAGKAIFLNNCAACHLEDGGGSIGPNLTDKYWLHGNTASDIYKVIKYGVQGTGMKSWESDFSAKQIVQLTSFVKSLENSTPKSPKDPEGKLYEGEIVSGGE